MAVTGIVLAGGLSRRLGRDKAVEPIDGEPLISRVIRRLEELTDEIVVVVNNSARGAQLPLPDTAKVAVDIYPDSGSLGGIFSGLSNAKNDWGFVVACDMPFLNSDLISHILTLRHDPRRDSANARRIPGADPFRLFEGLPAAHRAPLEVQSTEDRRLL